MKIEFTTIQVDPRELILPSFAYDEDEVNNFISGIKEGNSNYQLGTIVCIATTVVLGHKYVKIAIDAGIEDILVKVIKDETLTDIEIQDYLIKEGLKANPKWPKQVGLILSFHKLKQDQKGIKVKGSYKGWGVKDTALELGYSEGMISEDLRLAEYCILHPEIKQIKEKVEAWFAVSNILKRSSNSSNNIEIESQVIQGKPEEVLLTLDDGIFDCCIFVGSNISIDGGIFSKELYRVLRYNSFLFIIDPHGYYDLNKQGFKVQTHNNIWIKEGYNKEKKTKTWEYNKDYESILVAVKGSPALNNDNLSSIYSSSTIRNVITKILHQSTQEGNLILDPFGSFDIQDVCKLNKRKFISIRG